MRILGRLLIALIVGAVFFGVRHLINLAQTDSAIDNTERNDTGEVVTEGDIGVLVLKLGDCVMLPSNALSDTMAPGDTVEVETLRGVPCNELHDGEIFYVHKFFSDENAEYPGNEVLLETIGFFCEDRYEDYTGVAWLDSQHDIFPLTPTAESWGYGDREGQCIAANESGEQLSASIRQ